MIKYEQSKINHQLYVRVTSDKENYYVKIKGSSNEPTNEIMIKGETTDLKFEEIYVEPVEENEEQVELFGMEREDYEEKKKLCAEMIIELRSLEKCETITQEKPKNKPQMIIT